MIAVQHKPTAGTPILSFGERYLLSMSTSATILAGVGRVHRHISPTGTFSLVGETSRKLTPRRVTDALGQAMVVDHLIDGHILARNHLMVVDDLPALLMSKVLASVNDAFMHPRHGFAALRSLRRAFDLFRQTPLHRLQGFLVRAEETRVVDGLAVRESRKVGQAHVDPDIFRGFWQDRIRNILAHNGHKPLARPRAFDTARLGRSLQGSMDDRFHSANLGEHHRLIARPEPRLRITERVVPPDATKAREPWFVTCLDSAKERIKRQFKPHSNVLQNLAIRQTQRGTFALERGKCLGLVVQSQGLARLLIDNLALLKQMIVQPTALIKCLLQDRGLGICGVQTILKGFCAHASL